MSLARVFGPLDTNISQRLANCPCPLCSDVRQSRHVCVRESDCDMILLPPQLLSRVFVAGMSQVKFSSFCAMLLSKASMLRSRRVQPHIPGQMQRDDTDA